MTLHTATSLTLNSMTDIFLQLLQGPQNRCLYHNLNLFSAETNYKKLTHIWFSFYIQLKLQFFVLHCIIIDCVVLIVFQFNLKKSFDLGLKKHRLPYGTRFDFNILNLNLKSSRATLLELDRFYDISNLG